MLHGDARHLADLSPAQAIDALQKLCHDLLAKQAGAKPRFFESSQLMAPAPLSKLTQWGKSLSTTMMTMDHPFNTGLMLETLVGQAQRALNSKH